MSVPSKRATWLPWAVALCFALISAQLAYERFHLHLLIDSFIQRDHIQQRELDRVHGREIALQKSLDDALSRLATCRRDNLKLQKDQSPGSK